MSAVDHAFFSHLLNRPVGVSLMALAVFLLGALAFFFLPVSSLPSVDYPTIMVTAALPGAEPETMASAVAAPLERQLGQIAGVAELTSSSLLGSTSIVIQFDLSRRIDDATRDVQAAINAAGSNLPSGMSHPPSWRKTNPSAAPVLILALTSAVLGPGDVYEEADKTLVPRISQIPGVGQVTINGAQKPAVRVRADPAALAGMNLGLESVRAAINVANASGPKGRIDAEEQSYVIRANDQLRKAEQYNSLIIANRDGTPVRLDMVASVVDSVENVRTFGWFDSRPAVLVFVFKEANANVIETVDRIRDVIPMLTASLPRGIDLSVVTDRTRTIRSSVHEVELCLLISIGLIVVMVFVFLRQLWATVAAAVTIPLSIAGTFAVMYLVGYSLDNLSLMALTIGTGFIVDDAIVVVEAISQRLANGERPFEAAVRSIHQIGFTVLSISVSLIAAFIPLLFMGGMIGRIFREFAVTLSVAIAVSAIISMILTPVIASQMAPRRQASLSSARGDILFQRLLSVYRTALLAVLRHRRLALVITCSAVAGTALLAINVPKGFFPQQDTGTIMAIAEAPTTVSFNAMTKRVQALMNIIMDDPAVAHVASYTGNAGASSNQANISIDLKPHSERVSVTSVIGRLRTATRHVSGVLLYLVPYQELKLGGRISKSQYQYTLTGPDLTQLSGWANRLVAELKFSGELKDVTTDLQSGALQTKLVIDRDAAARLGVAPNDIDQVLYDAFGQRLVSTVYDRSYTYHVVLEADPDLQEDPSSLSKMFVSGPGGTQVPLASVVGTERSVQMSAVPHQGQSPAITLSFSMHPGSNLQLGTQLIERAMRNLNTPKDIQGSFQGNARAFTESLGNEPLLIAAALISVYLVLGVLYESTIHPLTILSTLPSAGIGAILGTWWAGLSLDIIGFIGVILLIGIVKKNGILIIDYALFAEREHAGNAEAAILEACMLRFRPILMTTLTAILGAVPLVVASGVGSELRYPLGVSIIGGLLLSQLLTLFTTPVVYLALDRFRPNAFSRGSGLPRIDTDRQPSVQQSAPALTEPPSIRS